MIRRALIVAAFAALPGAGHALSCLPHDVAAVFHQVHGSPDIYIGAYGKLTFDSERLPVVDWEHQETTPPQTAVPARLRGHALSADGFKIPFDRRVMLHVQCAGPWCAQPVSGAMYMGFLKSGQSGYSLTIGPCGGDAFADPDAASLETARQCFAGGPCVPNTDFPQ